MKQSELPQPRNTEQPESEGDAWLAAMAHGDFPRSWAVSDRVLARRPRAGRDDPALPYHLRWVWDGTAPDGRDTLVRCYHGLGDSIQFLRFLPALRRRARQVTLEIQPELMPLAHLLDAADLVVPFDPAVPLPPLECDIEIMELCHALRVAPEPVPYLPVPPATGIGRRAGLCWHVPSAWRPQRSVPLALAAGLPIDGLVWHSLQPGAAFPPLMPCSDALMDTARLVAGLDLVVTVDTMVAHLAGAIGVPVWLLLDAEPDWRWQAGGPRSSPWYRSVRKYRQPRPGAWDEPLRELRADLTRLLDAGTVPR